MTEVTIGSLFSGSGGFELAASICGIKPVWASEIEPLPILVTKKNFPEMKHLGDIGYIKGDKIGPVTIISGGSPCQDMSIAGQRAGLDGDRSGLFRQQIRIVKEMRNSDTKRGRTGKDIRPRFMVWENVPGAFSSNRGGDFQAVLQEIAGIADETAAVPLPSKSKWAEAGCIMGDTFSIAWRTLDAEYWGVPQRRNRIFLVADFGGNTAPKVLFERQGLRRDFKESREAWQGTAGNSERSAHPAGRNPVVLENHPQDSRVTFAKGNIVPTLTGQMGTGGNNVPMIMDEVMALHLTQDPTVMDGKTPCITAGNPKTGQATVGVVIPIADKATRYKGGGDGRNDDGSANGLGVGEPGDPANTLTASDRHAVAYAIQGNMIGRADKNGPQGNGINEEVCFTLNTADRHAVACPVVAFEPGAAVRIGGHIYQDGKAGTVRAEPGDNRQAVAYAIGRDNLSVTEETAQSLTASDVPGSVAHSVYPEKSGTLTVKMAKGTGGPAGDECQNLVAVDYVIRRLTPLECCRLQGFPDDWTENIAMENPSAKTIREWMIIWAEWWRLIGRADGIQLPKDAKQTERWLADPVSDSALYKMWGNGIALPCAIFVFEGIMEVLREEEQHEENSI